MSPVPLAISRTLSLSEIAASSTRIIFHSLCIWFTRFIAGPVFTDTTDDEGNVTTAADNEAAYRQGIDAKAAENIRTERNKKLADTDWTQLADSTANATAWGTYRQELRDLPSTDGFPHNVTWPTEPS